MYPHERSLVQKLQGKPFVLLGVNSDQTRAAAKQAVLQNQLTWRSWFAGSGGGTIARTYGIEGWPTLFLLDGKGVIRYKHVGAPSGNTLEQEIDTLLQEQANGP
jgi:hypothetical protein